MNFAFLHAGKSILQDIAAPDGADERNGADWRIHWAIFAVVSIAIVWLSVWQGAYNLDPHHWGLMLSNAKDLAEGKSPYRDIFIQYGILTTIVHAASFELLGHNLRSIILSTAIFYAIGLIGIYFVSLQVFGRRSRALHAYMSCAAVHALCIYPWSNYVAFPFLTFGLAAFLWRGRGSVLSFAAGLMFSSAILAREGLIAPVLAFAAFATLLDIFERPTRARALSLALFWVGLAIPIASFFGYLLGAKLFGFWYDTAVILPRLYYEFFSGMGLLTSPVSIVNFFRLGVAAFNPRVIFFGLIILAACAVLLDVCYRRSVGARKSVVLLSVMTLLLISAAVHLAEVFRLVTSVAVGAGLIFYVASMWKLEKAFFWLMLGGLLLTWRGADNGNYFFPSAEQIRTASSGSRPAVFAGQRWPQEAFAYYADFESSMTALQAASCGIKYHYNDTKDAFLAVMSPFAQYQLAPFGRAAFDNLPVWRWSQILRPDYDIDHKIKVEKDVVIFQTVKAADVEAYRPPAGYGVSSRRQMPKSHFFPDGDFLLVVVPDACMKAP